MGVMPYDEVGPCINDAVGRFYLCRYGAQRVLTSPVWTDHDDGLRVVGAQLAYPRHERVFRFLADAGSVGQVGVVFQGHAQRGNDVDVSLGYGITNPAVQQRRDYKSRRTGDALLGDDERLYCFGHVQSGTERNHPRSLDIALCVDETGTPLVDAVVVGQVQMGDAVSPQHIEPFGFGTEDVALEVGLPYRRGRTL